VMDVITVRQAKYLMEPVVLMPLKLSAAVIKMFVLPVPARVMSKIENVRLEEYVMILILITLPLINMPQLAKS